MTKLSVGTDGVKVAVQVVGSRGVMVRRLCTCVDMCVEVWIYL